MFYHALAAVPEWAPPGENHILYSEDILKNVVYDDKKIQYVAAGDNGTEYLRLSFKPKKVTLNESIVELTGDTNGQGYFINNLGSGNYAVTIKRQNKGTITISGL
jgi:GTPase